MAQFATRASVAPTGMPLAVRTVLRQLRRYGGVGLLNTLIDLIVLNGLIACFGNDHLLLLNGIAYATGAVNSYVLNRLWTFAPQHRATWGEVVRFALVTLLGIACNDALLWLAQGVLAPFTTNRWFLTNAAKVIAIGGTTLLSYLGLRLWVFAAHQHPAASPKPLPSSTHDARITLSQVIAHHGISMVLPAFNEAAVIGTTVGEVVRTLTEWSADFEVIVVDDGSSDQTAAIVNALATRDERIRLIQHPHNQGYGAALVTGFAAASKDLTCFMDADGQFAVTDLARLLVWVPSSDVVIGYRVERQDTRMRRFNAWGWNLLVRICLGVRVRDLDCAFKLLPTAFLHAHPLTTRGAMINAELLYQINQAGLTFHEVGVNHLPRKAGRSTGARPDVILRALRDLAVYTLRWRVLHQTEPLASVPEPTDASAN